MILEQLIEKKDMMAYIDYRTKYLKLIMEDEILKQLPRNRMYIKQKFDGRINELQKLKTVVHSRMIKEQCKIYYKKLNNKGDLNGI